MNAKELKRRYEDATDTDDVMRVATDAIASLASAEAALRALVEAIDAADVELGAPHSAVLDAARALLGGAR